MDLFRLDNVMDMSVIWISILAIFAFVLVSWNKRRKLHSYLEKIPGPPPRFPFGNLGRYIEIYRTKTQLPNSTYILQNFHANAVLYGGEGMYKFWFASTPIVSVLKAHAIEAVLSSSTSLDKSWEYSFLQPWLGLGLLTSTGAKWRSRRKLLTPSFHFRVLEDFIPVFNDQSMVLVKKLNRLQNEECVNITPLVTLCTLDIVSETVMGVHIGAQDNSELEYVKAIHELGDYFNHRTTRPWLWPNFLFYRSADGRMFKKNVDILHSFTRKVIKEKKESLIYDRHSNKHEIDDDQSIYFSNKKRKAFLDILLDLHIKDQLLSEEDIREEVDTFMFEGHDTTAMGISWSLYCIGLYPEVQKRIVEELDAIFGGDRQRPITHDDIREMRYLECAIKESQRLYPPVPVIGRKLSEDISIRGITIPRGTIVHLSITSLHRCEKEFPNPQVFDPERFFSENAAKRHPYSYIPFSAGPRNCIGQKFAMMEEKVVISNILRNFKIISLDPRDKINEKVEFVLRPAQPLRLKFIQRNL